MRIPAARERVHIDGCEGVFLVVGVDQERRTVDLIPVSDGDAEDGVPFARIQPVGEDGVLEVRQRSA